MRAAPIRVTGPSTARPAMLACWTTAAPDLPMRHCRSPTLIVTASALSVTRTGRAGTAGRPRVTLKSSGAMSAGIACALHLIEPSGQLAVVQPCDGIGVPSRAVTLSAVPRLTAPRGQATPNVCPGWSAGAAPSIQRTGAA